MLPFPEARPTGPSASFNRVDSSEYGDDPFHSPYTPQNQKDLPQIPTGSSYQASCDYSMEEKKGIKWWWKSSSRKEKERRKSLGIGSSRTSYHVDHLSHDLEGIRIESSSRHQPSSRPLSRDARAQHNSGGRPGDYSYETKPITPSPNPSIPPPIPPRPRVSTPPRLESSHTHQHIQQSPTKLYRKYDPPPLQVPAEGRVALTTPSPAHPASSAHYPAHRSQRSDHVPDIHYEKTPPHFGHTPNLTQSVTAPTIYNAIPKADHLAFSHRSSLPILANAPILWPSHRTNISRSLHEVGASSHSLNALRLASAGPASPNVKKTCASDAASPASRLNSPAHGNTTSTSQQCAGYTKQGKQCRRMVKVAAPYAVMINNEIRIVNGSNSGFKSPGSKRSDTRPMNGQEDATNGEEPRFCRDHAKTICEAKGFYWKGGQREKWIDFSDWIPEDLEEQTKVLLRLTMESALTDKESKGFIYAYELRDLQSANVAYYKVGRTENVPRRLDEWKKRCSSHHPTLRDVFPLDESDGPGQSMLPGAMKGGLHTDLEARKACPAVKRLERLIHIELAAHAAKTSQQALGRQRYACPDCQTLHQEIFGIEVIPFGEKGINGSGWEYEKVVKTAILRWEAFVKEIME